MAVLRSFLTAALFVTPAAALAGPPPKTAHHPAPAGHVAPSMKRVAHIAAPAVAKKCMSIGSPTNGKLVNGCHLPPAEYMRVVPVYQPGDARWGHESLVHLVDRAAAKVRKQFPDAVLSVGHLSKHEGGEIDRHASHESGRDADLGFYVKSAAGKALYADHFVPFLGDGTAPSWPGAKFDDAKNWALVAALVGDGQAKITHIFVATPIRARLLAYAQKIGAPENLRNRAAELMAQPHGSLPHDDHFHVRIACPPGSDKCVELPQRKHSAIASHKPAHESHDARVSAKPAAPPAPPTKPKPAPPSESHETSSIPSLQEEVPGLDSAVIPKPIAIPPKSEEPAAPSKPTESPIDDPDGILEK